ncbi:MAG: hypothetical protein Q9166_003221 [cf. Caloplaca sp. 2 TL-2023]
MPNFRSNEQAFLQLIKSLQKGKGKENVPTDILALAQPFKDYRASSAAAPVSSNLVEEGVWPDAKPATVGALTTISELPTETLPFDPPDNEENAVEAQANQQSASPVVRGRGSNRYASVFEEPSGPEPESSPATVGARGTSGREELAQTDAEIAQAEERYEKNKRVQAEQKSRKETVADKVFEETMKRAVTVAREVAAGKGTASQTATINSLDEDIARAATCVIDRELHVTTPSITGTGNDVMVDNQAATEGPSSSRLPLPALATPKITSTRVTASTPLLSSGHEFLQALNKLSLPHPPTPAPAAVTVATVESESLVLPDDMVADELPTATKTDPYRANGETRPPSPLTQITTSGTLQTPTGEHTIYLAAPPVPTQTEPTPRWNSTSPTEFTSFADIISKAASRYRETYKPPTPPQEPLISRHHHLTLAPDHSRLPPLQDANTNGSLSSKKATSKSLTLLSGSGPKGYNNMPRRYSKEDLKKIGRMYWQKIFLALLERKGRGRIVIGLTEGV